LPPPGQQREALLKKLYVFMMMGNPLSITTAFATTELGRETIRVWTEDKEELCESYFYCHASANRRLFLYCEQGWFRRV
jgi:hypothetical protein